MKAMLAGHSSPWPGEGAATVAVALSSQHPGWRTLSVEKEEAVAHSYLSPASPWCNYDLFGALFAVGAMSERQAVHGKNQDKRA